MFLIIIIKITIIIIATIIIIINFFPIILAKRCFWRPKKEDQVARIGGMGGWGVVIRAMPERKRFFPVDVFPNNYQLHPFWATKKTEKMVSEARKTTSEQLLKKTMKKILISYR